MSAAKGRAVMRLAPFVLVAIAILAGCASPGKVPATTTSGAPSVSLAPGTGFVHGVVVDTAIRPIADAVVSLTGGTVNLTKTTGKDGVFLFESVAPGTYVLSASQGIYKPARTTVEVVAGVKDPAQVKVQLERLFSQNPYHETFKFDGFIQCGYSVSGAISSICFQDYTHFVGPTTCPQCEHVLDNRGTIIQVGAGWQTQIYEMTWDPSAQGTSPEMAITISFYPRVASHWYCQGGGPAPVLVRMESNVTCERSQGDPQPFPPEGLNNTYFFASTQAPAGQPASATVSQRFTAIVSVFYFGKPPADWSFIGGDDYPF